MKDPLGVSISKGNQRTTQGKEKILLTSVGIEPTNSGLDLPLLCRLSYEVGQRKSSPTFSPMENKINIYSYMSQINIKTGLLSPNDWNCCQTKANISWYYMHQPERNKITTLKKVWLLLRLLVYIRYRFSSAIQTPQVFNSLLGVWISRWNTVFRIWYIEGRHTRGG